MSAAIASSSAKGFVEGDGIVASLVEPHELRDPARGRGRPADHGGEGRLVWAGRLAAGKGLESLIEAVALDRALELDVLGDGPDRERLRRVAAASGAGDRVRWAGHVADRETYLDRLAAADAFVFPSPAEGFPKVVLDAFAVGLPVLATQRRHAGRARRRRSRRADRRDPSAEAVAAAWRRLSATDPAAVDDRRRRGPRASPPRHTRPAEAARLVERWRSWWPDLPWER